MEFTFTNGVPDLPRLPRNQRQWGGVTPARWSEAPAGSPSSVTGVCARCRLVRPAFNLRWTKIKDEPHGTWTCKAGVGCRGGKFGDDTEVA